MSGFEIAGVVLGAFPILISALEGYRDVARRVGLWYNIRQEYQKCRNEVNAQRVAFIGNLRRLLLPLSVDDVTVSRMLDAPGSDEWKSIPITSQLQGHLRDSYDVFLETIQEMQKATAELQEEMVMDPDRIRQKVNLAKSSDFASRLKRAFEKSSATRDYQLYRLQFSMGESVRKRLFDDMQKYNDRLRNLLETGDAVSQAQISRDATKQSRRAHSAMCGFWKHADRLYRALCRAWNCSCWEQHHAHLLLQDEPPVQPSFQLCFSSTSPNRPLKPISWPCLHTRVEVQDIQQSLLPIKLAVESTTPAIPQHRTSAPLKPSIMSKVVVPSVTITLGEAETKITTLQTIPVPTTQSHNQILSLCTSFRQKSCGIPQICHGYIQSDVDKKYYIYPLQQQDEILDAVLQSTVSTTTLSTLLNNGSTHRPLTRRQRYSLTVTIASSFLQLSGSPWVESPWTKSDLIFFKDHKNTNQVTLAQPFIGRDFQEIQTTSAHTGDERILGFESLGIVLLELCFGKPIEAHPLRSAFSTNIQPAGMTGFNLLVALEWLKDVAEEAGGDYAEAVAWCLVGGRTVAPGDGWRSVMLERVVTPLRECYRCISP
ncbi:hypothetical protein QBC44DRAFT_392949 [Cladorrhinum sp. PSN332]|nr:hypothetical protein QBC44DRAFT_392949 [Cladorrhinum sp. PSN332]